MRLSRRQLISGIAVIAAIAIVAYVLSMPAVPRTHENQSTATDVNTYPGAATGDIWSNPYGGGDNAQLFAWWSARPASSTLEVAPAKITWHSKELLQTIPQRHSNLNVYAIGVFESGMYAGDTLALGIIIKNQSYQTAYGYFISTRDGKPIVWDRTLLFDCENLGGCFNINLYNGYQLAFHALGFEKENEHYITDIPSELRYGADVQGTAGKHTHFVIGGADLFVSGTTTDRVFKYGQAVIVDRTPNGFPILRVPYVPLQTNAPDSPPIDILVPQYVFAVMLPFGGRSLATMIPDFTGENDSGIPKIIWQNGNKASASYHGYSYYHNVNIPDCFAGLTFDQLQASFIETGTTESGSPVYEVNPSIQAVYECLSKKSTLDPKQPPLYSPSEITTIHPLFFWQSPYGDWRAYVRDDVVPFDLLGRD